jgi:tetratricopeptide (TPR) repeat protein
MADFGRALSTKVQQPILAYTYVAIGNLYYEEGNDDKAVAAYGEAIKGPQDDLPMDMLLLRLGTSLQRTGKWAAADKYLGPLIDRYPKSAAAIEARRRFKADSFTVQTGAYSTAAAAQTEAQKLRAAGFTPRISQTTRAVPQPSFTQPGQPTSSTQVLYTVQVGKARTYVEALGQAQMLTRAGFAALIVP